MPTPDAVPLTEASAQDYVEHARVINDLARHAMGKALAEERSTLDMKVSIGLSLQAAELAGKSMLRSLGVPVEEIRKQHRNHNLPQLLDAVDSLFEADSAGRFEDLIGFQCHTVEVGGQEYGTTIGRYLDDHFAAGPTAMPRSYFYPDELKFSGPDPAEILLVMVDKLIQVASEAIVLAAAV